MVILIKWAKFIITWKLGVEFRLGIVEILNGGETILDKAWSNRGYLFRVGQLTNKWFKIPTSRPQKLQSGGQARQF